MANNFRLLLAAALVVSPCAAQNASVNGQVTNSVTRQPIARAHVLLFNQSRKYGAFTDAEGNFSFENVIPDSYQRTAEKMGFLVPFEFITDESKSVKLDPGVRHGSISLELIPQGSISGRVVDQNGEPVEGASVVAARGRISSQEVQTNEKGEFRLIGLAPGKYSVRAGRNEMPLPPEIRTDGTAETHFALTWYPGVTDPKSGSKAEVRPGSETDGIEIRMATSPIVGVRGQISGIPAEGRDVNVTATRIDPQYPDLSASAIAAPGGAFELWRLDPGKYRIRAEGRTPGDRPFQTAPEEIEVAGSNVDNLHLTVSPLLTLNGRLEFEGAQTREKLSKVNLVFNDIDTEDGSRPAELDGEKFRVRDLPPDRLHIEMGMLAYVKSMRLGQTEIDGAIVDLRHAPAGDELVLVVSSNMGSVAGTVRDDKGDPAKAWIGLMPADAIPGNFTYSMLQSKADGSYSFDGIAPGKYNLSAFAEENGPDFSDDDDAPEEVEIRAGEKTAKDLIYRQNSPI